MMPQFQLACPEGISEALHLITEIEGEVAFLSGGTDLILQLNEGHRQPDWVIDLSQICELSYIRSDGEWIRIGSTTTFTEISCSPLLREKARCLAQAASLVGSAQIRNRATLGGNIAGASPAGDSLPVLLALDAWLTIIGPAGERKIPFARFQSEAGQGLSRGEFIAGISIPSEAWEHNCSAENESEDVGHASPITVKYQARGVSQSEVTRTSDFGTRTSIFSAFGKIGSRRTVTIARLNMAARLEVSAEEGFVRNSALALGALGQLPFRLREVEEEIRGRRLDNSLISFVMDCLTKTVDQAIPGRYSQEYKRQAIRGLVADVLEDLARQLSNGKLTYLGGVKEGKENGFGKA